MELPDVVLIYSVKYGAFSKMLNPAIEAVKITTIVWRCFNTTRAFLWCKGP